MMDESNIVMDVLSQISEATIDEVTDARIALSQRVTNAAQRARRTRMRVGGIAACFVFIVSALLLLFYLFPGPAIMPTPPDTDDTGRLPPYSAGSQIPIYQGMTVRREADSPEAGGEPPYFVQPNEVFFMEIRLSNPDGCEIISLTLNGQSYESAMFRQESTEECLLLQMTAPASPGHLEYTLEAIKYADGTEEKDVDMSDGNRSVQIEISYPEAPSVALTVQHTAVTEIGLSVHVSDPYALIGDQALSLELFQGDQLVDRKALRVGDRTVSLDGLSPCTDYEVVLSYTYDLNDGAGVQTDTEILAVQTEELLIFNSISVMNTAPVSAGERFFLRVNISNPCQATYQAILINGREYPILPNSATDETVFCAIMNEGQFGSGNITLTLEKVVAELDGTVYTLEPQGDHTVDVSVIGNGLTVEEIYAVVAENGAYVRRNYVLPSETAYLEIKLQNKEGYEVEAVTVNADVYTTLIKLDNEHYLVEIPFMTSWTEIRMSSIRYSKGDLGKTVSVEADCRVFKAESDEIQYVSTPADLLHMNDGAMYYELTGDIDLAGLEWRGGEFFGVLNGKGYSIQNMSFVGTVTNADAELGLFTQSVGVIENLNLTGIRFIVEQTSTDGHTYNLTFGGISAKLKGWLVIDNCSVDESSYICIDGNHVGGILGENDNSPYPTIRSCVNNGTVIGNRHVGGIAGYMMYDQSNIVSCENNGNVSGREHIDGIVGTAEGRIADCVNNGAVTGESIVGGIVGNTRGTLIDCLNTGDISGDRCVGGVVGEVGAIYAEISSALTDCFNIGAVSGTEYVGEIAGYVPE